MSILLSQLPALGSLDVNYFAMWASEAGSRDVGAAEGAVLGWGAWARVPLSLC